MEDRWKDVQASRELALDSNCLFQSGERILNHRQWVAALRAARLAASEENLGLEDTENQRGRQRVIWQMTDIGGVNRDKERGKQVQSIAET